LIRGILFDIKKFSIHDGPGIRTTVFFKGCPLRCAWCHNPESQIPHPEMTFRSSRCIGCRACVAACAQNAVTWNGGGVHTDDAQCTLCGACAQVCYAEARELVGREMSVAQAMAEIEQDVAFYDGSGGGVTVSGGEPLAQPEFLLALLRACREKEIHTVLDTCGYAPWETLDRVRPWVDLFLYDLKLIDDARHRALTEVSSAPILRNLAQLSRQGHQIVVRVPIIPGVNDDKENLRQMAAALARLPRQHPVELLPYHPAAADKYARMQKPYDLTHVRPPSDERMAELADLLRDVGLHVNTGG
jgi:pyruvate formate lyase activating enzyme